MSRLYNLPPQKIVITLDGESMDDDLSMESQDVEEDTLLDVKVEKDDLVKALAAAKQK